MKYFDAFGEGGYHSAFMTTFAFGTLAFEDIPYPKLRGAGCWNITVLADREMVNQAFSEFGMPVFAGTSYHIVKAHAPTAFHPKITLLIGETKGRMIVGSANLTALGLGGNKEQVASITYSAEEPENAQFFVAALDYMRRYVPADDEWFPESLRRALRSTPWLRDAAYDPAFLGDGTISLNLLFDRPEINLLDQIVACVGGDTIERLVIVSPYWDSKLEGLARLKAGLGNPPADILIENDNGGFPSTELARFTDVSLFDASAIAAKRFLHAKLIVARGREWDHVISGSMNCTRPALLGPREGGNAEAAIYKRTPRGSALEALELSEYASSPIQGEQLVELQKSFVEPDKIRKSMDGGTLTLERGKVSWTPPAKMHVAPLHLSLHTQDEAQISLASVDGQTAPAQVFQVDVTRPKFGILHFVDGAMSAPIQVVDIDVLTHTTSPAHRGLKKRIVDMLSDAVDESLDIITALSGLEDADAMDRAGQPPQEPKARAAHQQTQQREYQVLSYEQFIRARTLANEQGKPFGLYFNSRQDTAASLISAALNRMIGLVGPNFKGEEEGKFQAIGRIDFRTTEPQSANDDPNTDAGELEKAKRRIAAAQSLATAKKFQDAVSAFEVRSKSLASKGITTTEMVRLRALMQIILSHAQPISGSFTASQILPVYNSQGHDWPRLIGRLLIQHFGATRALQSLSVENDESEQQRVLEYLALSNYAARAALAAATSEKKAGVVRAALERMVTSLASQTQVILGSLDDDKAYFDEMTKRLDERFESRLGLSKVAA